MDTMPLLPRAFVRQCKRRKFRSTAADSSGVDLSGGSLLMRTLILRRLLRRHVLTHDEQAVGLLLPPSVSAVATNMALALDRRIGVNLNYSVTPAVMNQCIETAGIEHVISSRRVMEKLGYDLACAVVYLEDLAKKPTWADKIAASAGAYTVPSALLERALGLDQIRGDDVLTIIFTSGSTGIPKGVMLTHANVGATARAIDQVIRFVDHDVIVGILPFFHSFGYAVTLWTAMTLNLKGIYHFNPLDVRQIGKLCAAHRGTILLTTPTFLRMMLRRGTREQLESLDVVVAGAEKLPLELCDAFEKKFGARPVEGYGATELAPLVSVNIPPSRPSADAHGGLRQGTVGRPVPGVSAKVVDLATGEERAAGEPGMLLIRGANVMKGYLNQPEKTAEVFRDGWYVTGDVAVIDQDGFIKITGRESRFAKIGGEMVPLVQVEEALAKIIGGNQQDNIEEGVEVAVAAVPHATKGERIVVLHTAIDKSPQELCEALAAEGLPRLFIPSPDSFHQVKRLPVLGAGTLDLKGIKEMALEVFGK
jgi:acyl-[acyl-carrier-protein]-phospholipid O-acyltransferase / long-chain-fatty-acid--[acyl-carrier-protein] ligase